VSEKINERSKCGCPACQEARKGIQYALDGIAELEESTAWQSTHRTFQGYCLDRWGCCPLDLGVETLLISSRKRTVLEWDEADDEDF
jgi:hypothetical protein